MASYSSRSISLPLNLTNLTKRNSHTYLHVHVIPKSLPPQKKNLSEKRHHHLMHVVFLLLIYLFFFLTFWKLKLHGLCGDISGRKKRCFTGFHLRPKRSSGCEAVCRKCKIRRIPIHQPSMKINFNTCRFGLLTKKGNQQLKLHSGMLIFAMLIFEDCYHLPIQTMTHLH